MGTGASVIVDEVRSRLEAEVGRDAELTEEQQSELKAL